MISEIDIRDFDRSEQPVKLYDVPRNSVIQVCTMDGSPLLLNFHHIDGMYSLCTVVGTGEVVHLNAWLDVFVYKKTQSPEDMLKFFYREAQTQEDEFKALYPQILE